MIEVKDFLKKQFGVEAIENKNNQLKWLSWYKNSNRWLKYQVTQPNEKRTKTTKTRHSLNSCKRVCEDWANLLLNEKTDIVVSKKGGENTSNKDNTYNEKLHEVLKQNDFWTFANKAIEKVYALGSGAFIIGKNQDGTVNIDFVDGTRCYVMNCNCDEVIDCAFENITYIKGEKYTILNVHIKNKDKKRGYTIYNYLFNKDGVRISDEQMTELIQVLPENKVFTKCFAFITPQNLSGENWDTPFSDSVFAKAIDANKMIDLAFDSYCNEFILGKKRIFVASELVTYAQNKTDGTTVRVPVFDENEIVFNLLPEQTNGEVMLKEVNMDLRVKDHQSAIQDALNFFASLCGLGEKYYMYNQGSVATATQIVSENSTLFRNIQKQQIAVEKCLKEICTAIFGLMETPIDEKAIEVAIQFDDSIIEDKAEERKRDLIDVDKGIMSKAEYRAKWYGETPEQAQKIIDDIDNEEMEKEISKNKEQNLI
jgi:A118 family predicted phage portal protein